MPKFNDNCGENSLNVSVTGRSATAGHPTGPQRFRELLVEPHQLQELPPTAMIFTHATRDGRRVLLVDANPGIVTLPTTHSVEYEEFLRVQQSEDGPAPQPNLGPPPDRLDFRREKR